MNVKIAAFFAAAIVAIAGVSVFAFNQVGDADNDAYNENNYDKMTELYQKMTFTGAESDRVSVSADSYDFRIFFENFDSLMKSTEEKDWIRVIIEDTELFKSYSEMMGIIDKALANKNYPTIVSMADNFCKVALENETVGEIMDILSDIYASDNQDATVAVGDFDFEKLFNKFNSLMKATEEKDWISVVAVDIDLFITYSDMVNIIDKALEDKDYPTIVSMAENFCKAASEDELVGEIMDILSSVYASGSPIAPAMDIYRSIIPRFPVASAAFGPTPIVT